MNIWVYLNLAAEAAKRDNDDCRVHCHGCVGLRSDGTIVRSRNGSAQQKMPPAHAEARLVQKLDYGATVFIARVRKNGMYALSKPCEHCRVLLRIKRVKQVFYTTDEPNTYECWTVS